MTLLPRRYDSPLHLPFNRHGIEGRFRPGTPDRDPGGPGPVLLLLGHRLYVAPGNDGLRLPEEPEGAGVFLGTWDGRPCRVREAASEGSAGEKLIGENLLALEPGLPVDLLTLGGIGVQVLHWEQTSRLCSGCGGDVERLPGEWGKRCRACGRVSFPHIHPCVIVLVERPGELLLVRKPAWPAGRFSLVAGFLEFGECLEEAVRREVAEETGVRVEGLAYVGSQCWPFPSQLMVGYRARYAGGELRPDPGEIEEARWFPLDRLPTLPPPRSIARHLIDGSSLG